MQTFTVHPVGVVNGGGEDLRSCASTRRTGTACAASRASAMLS